MLAALLLLAGCKDDATRQAEALQFDIRRAGIESKSLGRFGIYALLDEEFVDVPCEKPLGPDNRICDVNVVGKGPIRLVSVPAEWDQKVSLKRHALMRIEYRADCSNEKFDFKTFDQVLPRRGSESGVSVWADKLVKVTHTRLGDGELARCRVEVEVAEPLLERIRAAP